MRFKKFTSNDWCMAVSTIFGIIVMFAVIDGFIYADSFNMENRSMHRLNHYYDINFTSPQLYEKEKNRIRYFYNKNRNDAIEMIENSVILGMSALIMICLYQMLACLCENYNPILYSEVSQFEPDQNIMEMLELSVDDLSTDDDLLPDDILAELP